MSRGRSRRRTRARCEPTPGSGRRAWLCAGLASVALGLASLWPLGCHRSPSATGRAPRVVSVSPNTTETVFAIGAGALLVGRSSFCDQPEAAKALPVVGGFADPSVEAIVGLQPTLVVGDRGPAGPALEQRLQAHGIDTYFPAVESVADISRMMLGLGERLDHAQAARELVAQLERDIRVVADRAASRPPVKAVLVFDPTPIVVAGPGGFADEILRLAGGQNLIDRGGAYPTIGLERLLALDPDVIVDATEVGAASKPAEAVAARSSLADKPGWSELRAVRSGRMPVLRGSAALRPGPRIAQGLDELERALHPEAPSP